MSAKSLHRCANIIFSPEFDLATRHDGRRMFLHRCFYNEHLIVYFVDIFFRGRRRLDGCHGPDVVLQPAEQCLESGNHQHQKDGI